jgi:sulfur carrier protein
MFMKIVVNNNEMELPESAVLQQLLTELQLPSLQGIAVAVNQQVIPKTNWSEHRLHERDAILIIRATQGG